MVQAGLPKGVLNFISTSKADAPARVAQIIAHPAVRKVNVRPVQIPHICGHKPDTGYSLQEAIVLAESSPERPPSISNSAS